MRVSRFKTDNNRARESGGDFSTRVMTQSPPASAVAASQIRTHTILMGPIIFQTALNSTIQ
jgi:hypothetical protein